MRKGFVWVISLAVILLIVIGLVPFFIGLSVKKNATNIVASLLKGRNAQVTLVDYKSGWFHSSATVRILFSDHLSADSKPLAISLHETFSHGPFVHTKTGWEFAKAAMQVNSLTKDYPVSANGELSFMNNITAEIVIPTMKTYSKGANNSVAITNLAAHIVSNLKTGDTAAVTTLSALDANVDLSSDRAVKLTFNNIKSRSNFNLNKPLFASAGMLSVAQLKSDDGVNKTTVNNMVVHTAATTEQGKAKLNLSLQAASLASKNSTFTNINLAAAVAGLNSDKLSEFVDLAHKFQAQSNQGRKEMAPELNKSFLSAVANNLDLNIQKFSVLTPQGPMSFDLHLTLPQQTTAVPSYFVILAGMQADFNAQMTKAWLHSVLDGMAPKKNKAQQAKGTAKPADRVAEWIKSGILIADGNNLKVSLAYKDGQMTVNSKPFSMFGGGAGSASPSAPQAPAANTVPAK